MKQVLPFRHAFFSNENSKGVTLVEVAIGIPVLLFVVLISIDFSFAWSGYFILKRAASAAATKAASMPNFDIDLANVGANDFDCTMYNEALYRIEQTARDYAVRYGIVDSGTGGLIKLLPFSVAPVTASGSACIGSNIGKEYFAGILRPGEAAIVDSTLIDHPEVSGASGRASEEMSTLFPKHKVMVDLRARYSGILLKNFVIDASAERPRQTIRRGPFGEIHNEQGNLVVASIPEEISEPLSQAEDPAQMPVGASSSDTKWGFCMGPMNPRPLERCADPNPAGDCMRCIGLGSQ